MLDDRGGDEVLHGISFTAQPGQMVALVGSSGAGKSTIASLLARLYDVDSGAVRLNGVDVRDADLRVAEGHRRHGDPGRPPVPRVDPRPTCCWPPPSATDEQMWEALRRARLADVVAEMPDGLDTVVGERGYRLSGGQRQRLTIARLLLGRSRVVVLDEATASLDSESEAAVQQALAEALEGRTSHRHRPPAVHRARGRRHPRRRGRPRSSNAAPTKSCSPVAVATPSCTRPSSATSARSSPHDVGRSRSSATLSSCTHGKIY